MPPDSEPDKASQQAVEVFVYEHNFDELEKMEQQLIICNLLATLPSVRDMKDFLTSDGGSETLLSTWTDRISPAALGLLRWIIASNRSCIMQVDGSDSDQQSSEERVSGMPGWMQFRFAQGAPDKEQRFITAIRETTYDQPHPTIFAWHGSPLPNWHGIVREGLHFENVAHGRAFGNGVYHALHVATSLGYSTPHHHYDTHHSVPSPADWWQSQLKITQAIVLNEIVNAPARFVSTNPHLVVANLDWIQSRYLFVKCGFSKSIREVTLTQQHSQDPKFTPTGQGGLPVQIPFNAVSKSRRTHSSFLKTGNKNQRIDDGDKGSSTVLVSDESEVEDDMIFFPTEREEQAMRARLGRPKPEEKTMPQELSDVSAETDFVPGTYDPSSLPLTKPPIYATPAATRTLQRELNATLRIQDKTAAAHLGWYLDRELITNMYQWIVELHSFEPQLPLAKDLKTRGLKSVVLEIRFGKDYPMSPPFVRVIRPRFLSFMEGGGGHVTAGGALCMELLTNSGWSSVSSIESVLLQVRLAMSSTDPRPARLASGGPRDYTVGEAIEAFVRACTMHGWQVPPEFRSNFSEQRLITRNY